MEISPTDERFMRLAIAAARQGVEQGQSPFGACIVEDGEVVSCTHNVVWATTDITAHAEVHAIRLACQARRTIDLSGCTMYATCEPCPMCFTACHWARLSRIVFGTRIADAQELGFSQLTIPSRTMQHLGQSPLALSGDCLRDENLQLFAAWHRRGDGDAY